MRLVSARLYVSGQICIRSKAVGSGNQLSFWFKETNVSMCLYDRTQVDGYVEIVTPPVSIEDHAHVLHRPAYERREIVCTSLCLRFCSSIVVFAFASMYIRMYKIMCMLSLMMVDTR